MIIVLERCDERRSEEESLASGMMAIIGSSP
jgi:hypothetical protein